MKTHATRTLLLSFAAASAAGLLAVLSLATASAAEPVEVEAAVSTVDRETPFSLHPPTKTPPDDRSAFDAAPGTLGAYSAPVGTRLLFTFQTRQETAIIAAGAGNAPKELTMSARGEMELCVLDRRDDTALVSVSFSEIEITATGDGERASAHVSAEAASELASPLRIRVAPDGRIEGWAFPEGASLFSRGVARSVLETTRFVAPKDGGAAWETLESDSTGEYGVRYSTRPEPSGTQFVERERYQHDPAVSSDSEDQIVSIHDRSHASFDSSLGWLTNADCHQELGLTLEGFDVEVRSKLSARLELIEESVGTVTDKDIRWDLNWFDASEAALAHEEASVERRGDDAERIEGENASSLIARLDSAVRAAGVHSADAYEARELLETLLDRRPEEAERVHDDIALGGLDDETVGVVLGALGSVGTAATQRTLTNLLSDPVVIGRVRLGATIALFDTEEPTRESRMAVEAQWLDPELERDLRSTALLLLGRQARESDEATMKLLAHAARAEEEDYLQPYLYALLNAGQFSALKSYIDHADARIRGIATELLAQQ